MGGGVQTVLSSLAGGGGAWEDLAGGGQGGDLVPKGPRGGRGGTGGGGGGGGPDSAELLSVGVGVGLGAQLPDRVHGLLGSLQHQEALL